MKLVHLSDVHIHDRYILGADPVAHCRRALAHVAAHQSDADKLVITGDLSHNGAAGSYRRLRRLISDSGLPDQLCPVLLLGNHDNRAVFRECFPETRVDELGFVQFVDVTDVGWFVYLDTLEPGTHSGHYCARRQAWLDETLGRAQRAEAPVWLFMHHNPLTVRVRNADDIGLVHQQPFRSLLRRYRQGIRHIFFGHCHFTLSGSLCGIPVSAPRSTSHPCWPDFDPERTDMAYAPVACNYNVCFLDVDSTVVHTVDFDFQPQVEWLQTDASGWVVHEGSDHA